MYADGARIFVEVGPGLVLSNLVDNILGDKAHTAISLDRPGRHGITQLQHLLARLISMGVTVNLGLLYKGRFSAFDVSKGIDKYSVGVSNRAALVYWADSAQMWRDGQSRDGNVLVMNKKVKGNTQTKHVVEPSAVKLTEISGNGKKEIQGKSEIPVMSFNAIDPSNKDSKLMAPINVEGNGAKSNGEKSRSALSGKAIRVNNNTEQVILHFQSTMLEMTNNFLQAQKSVMLAYLQSKGSDIGVELEDALAKASGASMNFTGFNKAANVMNEPVFKRRQTYC